MILKSNRPHVHHEVRDLRNQPINPGNDSPIPGGTKSSGYGDVDPVHHPTGHKGNDWIKPDSFVPPLGRSKGEPKSGTGGRK